MIIGEKIIAMQELLLHKVLEPYLVDKIGPATEYGKIGKNIASAPDQPNTTSKANRKIGKTMCRNCSCSICLCWYCNVF